MGRYVKNNYQEILEDYGIEVLSVHQFDGKSSNFNLKINLGDAGTITLYGIRVVNGTKGKFLSAPARKGKDDKWYSYFYMDFPRDAVEAIINIVENWK